jgi:hypothetical protein
VTSAALTIVLCSIAAPLCAQTPEPSFRAGIHVSVTDSAQFHTRDVGIGGRLSWQAQTWLGIEGELTYFSDAFSDAVAFSGGRIEGLFGVTLGPRVRLLRPFVKARPGFLRYEPADRPIACIAIFPPPLSCTLAAGRTLLAFDIGGGLELFPSRRTFIRGDVGDRIVRFPSPVIDTSGVVHPENFSGHDMHVAIGGGVRF